MEQFMKYLVALRFFIASLIFIFNSATIALTSSHRETYTIYQTFSRQGCSGSPHTWHDGGCEKKECNFAYTTENVLVSVSATRCQIGWGPEPDCNDFDECKYGVNLPRCKQNCTNTYGSYICSCIAGYRLSSDEVSCDDIDECQERTSNCSQICYNTIGSYSCNCNTRYGLASDGRTCNEIDECTARTPGCNHSCSNTIGSYKCICNAGYHLTSDGRSCSDIDECTALLDNCTELENFTCKNSIGGYQCVCKSGFEQVGPRECRDINECEALTNNCTMHENLICENIIGSYKCQRDSMWTGLIIRVTVGVVVGIIFIIMAVVYFLRRTKKRNRNAEERTQRQASPEIDYAEVSDVSKKNTAKQERRSATTALCSAPEGKKDLQNKEAPKADSKYQDLVTVKEMKQVYEAIRKPLKSSDSSVQEESSVDSTHTKENKDLQNKVAPKVDSKYQDLVTVTEMKQVYEAIRKPFKPSDISLKDAAKEGKDVKIGKTTSDSNYQELSAKAEAKCVYEPIRK